MNDYIVIEYSNSTDFGNIIYHNGFENRLYIDSDVSKPEYELVEDGFEDGDGEFHPSFQKWSKKYSIEFYAQEFLVDALTLMALHDMIFVTLKNGESSLVKDVEVDYEWDANIECWALVTIKFSTDYITRTNCNENIGVTETDPVLTMASAYDADDSGAGEAVWDGTGVVSGTTAFFYTTYLDGVYSGDPLGAYYYSGGEWTEQEVDDNQFIEVTDLASDCTYLVKGGDYFYRIPHIISVVDNGDCTATVTALANYVENMFYLVQFDDGGGYDDDPAGGRKASDFPLGVVVVTGDDTFDFRIKWYTHNGVIGYSNVVNETITCP